MTKEELLSKGISEEVADEIIASFEDKANEDSLQALKKALDPDTPEDDLIKAKGGKDKAEKEPDDEVDDDKEYNESYMKKHMKRYMKENQKEFEGELKKCYGSMKKAIDDIDPDADGMVVQMEDFTPFATNIVETVGEMCKAITALKAEVEIINDKTEKNYSLMQKAAKVQIEQAEGLDKFLSNSDTGGPRGIVATEKMEKAINDAKMYNEQVYKVLFKATRKGDQQAGNVISYFESAGKNYKKLPPQMQEYVTDLMKAEAN